ncbi:MAG: alpha-amylase family glycosyl hydrolase [Prevotella sp.]|nr:alpha-amylase family glycosyl hydrolase [Prevotella sp.]MCM1075393.1 alpha-amylase family glycosyl hydrolase [Ruminococcus sp.]
MNSYISILFLALACVFGARAADVVTSDPSPLQQTSKDVVVYFHADLGNKGLTGQPASAQIYAHTGVITNLSTSNSDWKYAPAWGDNSAKYKLEYVSPDLWKLNIGDIRTYYGVKEGETVQKLAFVFRTADKSKEGKDVGNADIFVDVAQEGYQVALFSNFEGTIVDDAHTSVTFTITATAPSTLTLTVNGNPVKSQENATRMEVPYTFTDRGNYTVVAKGVNGAATQSVEAVYCYPQASPRADYPGGVPKQGALRNSDGTVTFCLAAPGKTSVMLVPNWDAYNALDKNVMSYQDYNGQRYFWTTVSGLDPDTQYFYYYLVDGTIKVADPYAKLILDPYNDKYISKDVYPDLPEFPLEVGNTVVAVYHENINKYDWKVKNFKGADKQNLVIYELLLRDFTGTEGASNGNGTLRQAIDKLPYLVKMGVNAIELLPVNEFNGNNSWGYNPNFYFAPDKTYGTPNDYKEFIDKCHQNGIAVILDLVFNQSDGLHPWYQMYDISNNPFYNKTAPHAYSVLNDWNQNHPLVEQQWHDCVKYWATEYNVDGFRFDLVKGLGDNDSYKSGTDGYNASRVARMTRIHAALSEVKPDAYFINENLAGDKEENEMAADGQLNWANVNNAACQFAMGYSKDSNLNRFNAERDSRTWGSTVSYAESHDEERMGYKQAQYGAEGVKGNHEVSKRRIGSLHAQMILSPGAHMIWQFSELGNDQTTKNGGGNNTDPKKVNWNVLEDADVNGLYENVCELVRLRTIETELFDRDAVKQMNFTEASWTNGRFLYLSKNDKELILAVNPNITGDRTFECSTMFASKNSADYRIESKSYNTNPSFNAETGKITVPANSYVVIANNKVSGIESIGSDSDNFVRNEVYSVGGNIIINGEYSTAEVFSTAGTRQPLTGLTPGIYIVRVDNNTFKVTVR